MSRLAAPSVFENRRTYRLIDADLRDPVPRLRFGLGHYFDTIDHGEALAHDFAAHALDSTKSASSSAVIGSPVDPSRRPVNVAISAVTIRHDRSTDSARLLLHWRDPRKVAHAGGL